MILSLEIEICTLYQETFFKLVDINQFNSVIARNEAIAAFWYYFVIS